MSSLSLLPTPQAAPAPALPPGPYDARVSKTGPLSVIITAFDDRHEWPATTIPRGPTPVVGAAVLVLVTDSRTVWVVPPASDVAAGDLKAVVYATPDPGWLLCDGSSFLRADHPELAERLSPGGGPTVTLPDLRDRVPMGASGSHALGSTGGEATHTLTIAEMPSHDHPPASPATNFIGNGSGFTVDTSTGSPISTVTTTGLRGGGGAHNNLQPYRAVNWMVKT